MNTQGVSVEFSVRLTTWLNRCYSYLAQGQQHELYWAGICDCIASFDGIYGVWIIKKINILLSWKSWEIAIQGMLALSR